MCLTDDSILRLGRFAFLRTYFLDVIKLQMEAKQKIVLTQTKIAILYSIKTHVY